MHEVRGRKPRVVFGEPAAAAVDEALARDGGERVLVFTGPSVARTPFLGALSEHLGRRLVGTCAECQAHTPSATVMAGIEAARRVGADTIVAVGGGSVQDGAKLLRIGLLRGTRVEAELFGLSGRAGEPHEAGPSLLAIPTTLSGAEFTDFAGLGDVASGRKVPIDDPEMTPDVVILDPAATVDTPDWLLLSTGIRAVDHCVESYASARPSPYADALVVESLALLASNLRRIRADRDDAQARLKALVAAWLAISAPALGVPLGASHAIGRVLGGLFGVAHGHTSCVLLPAVLQWNAEMGAPRQDRIAAILGDRTAAEGVARLVRDLGQPGSLGELGIRPERYDEIAERSLVMLTHHSVAGNSRPIRSKEDVLEILILAE